MKFQIKPLALAIAVATPLFGGVAPVAFAQGDEIIEELVTVGSRREARSAADSIAPIDVISAKDFTNNATSDISDLLRAAVPSYNVNTQPISDAATIVRPANLRGLSPDNTLVLLNGKRRHRASVISFLGGGIADGAHGPDVGVLPAIGLKQIEVLRDGASSQYGSDAIAGVINFVLKDDREGGAFEVKYGSTYEGDGDNFRISGNIGLPLGDNGFVNISAEFLEADDTIRSVQRADVLALAAAGNAAVNNVSVNTVTSEVSQIWGQPNVNDDFKIFINSGIEINDNTEVYAFGNYATRQVEGGFFYRNPTNRGGVYNGPLVRADATNQFGFSTIPGVVVSSFGALNDPDSTDADAVANSVASLAAITAAGLTPGDLFDSVLVGNLNGLNAADCPAGIPLNGNNGLILDQTVLGQVQADSNCFSFVELFPGGFVPRFGGDTTDAAFVVGVKGDIQVGNGLGYDVSYSYGNNKTEFFINNTINASLGPNQPFSGTTTSFSPGAYEQTDNNFNIDLNYAVPVGAFASDLNIAGGFETRSEEFTITEGDLASRQIGPLAAASAAFPNGQGFASSSNGFGGFTLPGANRATPSSRGFVQKNTAFYIDFEADITDVLTMQAAGRVEDYDSFGSTFDWKIGGLYKVNDNVRFRATYSTGFHAPTAGQANVVNVTTAFVGGVLADEGTLPLTSAAGQFVNSERALAGDQPFVLGPEESRNLSFGAAFSVADITITLDYFNITLEDRIATSPNIDFLATLQGFADRNNVASAGLSTSQLINALNGTAGFLAADFAGSEDLASFRVFTNNFDTKTQGLDMVASYPFNLNDSDATLSLALNYTDTEVTNQGRFATLGNIRLRQLEENIPSLKGNLTLNSQKDAFRWLVRANFHSSYFEGHLEEIPVDLGGEITFDVELGYEVTEGLELVVGAANVFDNQPDELEPGIAGIVGSRYPTTAPFGFNGGQYYFRARYSF